MKKFLIVLVTSLIVQLAQAADESKLAVEVYNADSGSFGVNATLIYGEKEVLLVDTGFTKADALRIAAKVLDSKKELKTIFISQADPDYYFGAEVLHALFPKANIITTPAVKAVIEKKLAAKLGFWGPKMGANAPVKPFIPSVTTGSTLTVDGHTVEIKGTQGVIAHRPYLWVPSNKTILGNVAIFGDIHLWMADIQTKEGLDAWKKQLNEMLALQPKMVVPGHMTEGTAMDNDSAIRFTLGYIDDFLNAKKASADSSELIKSMSAKYPKAEGLLNLNIAAKVHKGEMKW